MANNANTYEQVYNLTEDASVLSGVSTVLCVLIQRGVLVAGFNGTKELLTLHYTGYNAQKPVWELDFFEHLFAHEPLLTNRDRVKGVFICADKNLIVPDTLYDETEAKNWLRHIHFIEQTDAVSSYHLDEDKANYLFAVPLNITELIKINFKKAVTLPLPAYHFRNTSEKSLNLQCVITGEQVCATLHNYSQLLWHKVFDYSNAEDITYNIKHLCAENNINAANLALHCNTISAAEYSVLNGLSQYFPDLKAGNGGNINSQWAPVISLAQQLLACV